MSLNFGAVFHEPLVARRQGHTTQLRMLIYVNAACLIIAVLAVYSFLSPNNIEANVPPPAKINPAEVRTEAILVPVTTIEAGMFITPDMFRLESRPAIGLPAHAVSSYEELRGQYAKVAIPSGAPFTADFLTAQRPSNRIAGKIPAGFRAVTVSVDVRSSVEGWARPGSKVDVSWASRLNNEPRVTVIVQNALVLSAERHLQNDQNMATVPPTTVTLLVSDDDASKVLLASSNGSITLSLRGDSDAGGISGNTVTINDLLRGSSPQEKQEVKNQGSVTIRGFDGSFQQWLVVDGHLKPVSDSKS